MLPEWLDADTLRTGALVVLGVMVVVAVLVARFVQKMVMKVVLLGVLVGLGILVWAERAELADCARTCDCRLLGRDVEVPRCVDQPGA
jgi:hypothetical protein